MSLFLTACVGQPYGGAHTVVAGYEGQAAYLAALTAEPEADRYELYWQHVVAPYWEQCAAGGEFIDAYGSQADLLRRNFEPWRLQMSIDLLRQSELEALVGKALHKIHWWLPGPPTTVCVFIVDDYRALYVRDFLGGVAGQTMGSGKIWLTVNPLGNWEAHLPYALAHEAHHSAWISRRSGALEAFDLLDYIVMEGRADTFARLLYPQVSTPWTRALSPQQEQQIWQQMHRELDARDLQTLRQYVLGGGAVPLFSGYTVGFSIMAAFLQKNPDYSIREWTALDAEVLLEKSGYDGQSAGGK